MKHLTYLACLSILAACGGAPADETSSGSGGASASAGSGTGGSSSTSGSGGSGGSTSSTGGGSSVGPNPRDSVSAYFYGHSLIDFGVLPVGTAMCDVAAIGGQTCCGDGQWPGGLAPSAFDFYGYPPEPGQGHAPSCWQGWQGSFAASGFDALVITEANFIQYEGTATSIAAGSDLVATVRAQDPELPIYLYEHWPEFAAGITFTSWKNTDHGPYHAWFADVQDGLNDGVSGPPIRLVPVGRLFAAMLTGVPALDALSEADLFVDDAPHGTATSYFVAGLVHYMALYQRRPATDAAAVEQLSAELHPLLRDHYAAAVDAMWQELQLVVDGDGQSRVW